MWRPLRITRCRIDNLKHNQNFFSYINKKIIVNNLLWIRKDILRDGNNIWIIMITFYSDVWYVMKSDILKQIYFISEYKSVLSSTTHNRSIQNVHKYMYFSSFRNRNWRLLKQPKKNKKIKIISPILEVYWIIHVCLLNIVHNIFNRISIKLKHIKIN